MSPLPPIPDRVISMPFHRPYGTMATRRVKRIETRKRAFDREPCWIAVVNAAKIAKLQDAARKQPGAEAFDTKDEAIVGKASTVCGLLYIATSHLLTLDEMPLSFFFERGRFAWVIDHAIDFAEPIPIDALGLTKVPQSTAWVPGEPLRQAAARARMAA